MDRDSIDSLEVNKWLNELVMEMTKRYSFMKCWGCIDWQEVMDNEELSNLYGEMSMFGNKRIVLMIDELADLMYWDRQKNIEVLVGYDTDREVNDLEVQFGRYAPLDSDVWKMMRGTVEGCLIKIATLGRASGIHLILGTQRPDAKILSGQLRANLPCRICLRVSNKVERRIILGDSGMGNEREMLYLSNESTLKYNLR